MVQGIVRNPPNALTNHFRLTKHDCKESKAEYKGEGKDEVGEDKGRWWMIQTRNLRCFRLVRRLSAAIAIKVSSLGIRRVNFAMPCVVQGAPSRDLVAHAQPLQK